MKDDAPIVLAKLGIFSHICRKKRKFMENSLFKRYLVATIGLVIVAFGVALSLKSNLGTAPVSCPPAVLNLKYTSISVGTFTWMMHLVFILTQVIMLGREFKLSFLMQIPAAFVFGYLCDACIWLLKDVQVTSYAMQMLFCILTVIVTAVGVRMEIVGNAWMLAGEKTAAVVSEVTRVSFSNVKIVFDIYLVVISALFAQLAFGIFSGDGINIVIREGTLILAVFTGLCMKVTDPLVDKCLGKLFRFKI